MDERKQKLIRMYGGSNAFATPTDLRASADNLINGMQGVDKMAAYTIEMMCRNFYANIIADLIIENNIEVKDEGS